MSDYRCHRCGHPYPWRGGISYGAVCKLGRLVREHYSAAHPGRPLPDVATPPTSVEIGGAA